MPMLFLAYTSLYCVFYLALARTIRSFLQPGVFYTWIARCVMPVVFLFIILLPILVEAVATGGDLHEASPLHILNPFFMMDKIHAQPEFKLTLLGLLTAVVTALRLPDVKRGIGEVLTASAARCAPEQSGAA
jgi:hypothetical protein